MVIDMADHRPHFCLTGTDGNQHVLPVALVDDVIEGAQNAEALTSPVLLAIIREWRDFVLMNRCEN